MLDIHSHTACYYALIWQLWRHKWSAKKMLHVKEIYMGDNFSASINFPTFPVTRMVEVGTG